MGSIVRRLRGHGGFILVTLGAVLAGFGAVPGAWWVVIPAALLAIVGLVFHVRLDPSYSDLARREEAAIDQARATSAALQESLESILRRIAVHCEINETHQRISIYCHVQQEFIMLARESKSTALSVTGRGIYPSSHGVIGEAWDKGESLRRDWPADRNEWNEFQVSAYGLDPSTVAQLAMQSRSIVAMRLSHGAVHVGVIIMESTGPRGVMRRHLTAASESLLLEAVCEVLTSAQPHFPAVAEYVRSQNAARNAKS